MKIVELENKLQKARSTIRLLQDELEETNKGLIALNIELEDKIEEQQRTQRELQNAYDELESFSYSVSHDLRAPLRAIDGFAQILEEDYEEKLDDEGKRIIDVIRSNAMRMSQLINDILNLSRVSRKELVLIDINLSEISRGVIEELRQITSDRDMEFRVADNLEAMGDPRLVKQLLYNLISNSIKFLSKRRKGIIEIGECPIKDGTAFYVKDNGVGFDMKYYNKLFGLFQRLHGEDEFEGTGVGLAIVKRVIMRHGGRVWAAGRLNGGAIFYFTLPRCKEEEQ